MWAELFKYRVTCLEGMKEEFMCRKCILKSKIPTSHYVSLGLYFWKALVTFSYFECL